MRELHFQHQLGFPTGEDHQLGQSVHTASLALTPDCDLSLDALHHQLALQPLSTSQRLLKKRRICNRRFFEIVLRRHPLQILVAHRVNFFINVGDFCGRQILRAVHFIFKIRNGFVGQESINRIIVNAICTVKVCIGQILYDIRILFTILVCPENGFILIGHVNRPSVLFALSHRNPVMLLERTVFLPHVVLELPELTHRNLVPCASSGFVDQRLADHPTPPAFTWIQGIQFFGVGELHLWGEQTGSDHIVLYRGVVNVLLILFVPNVFVQPFLGISFRLFDFLWLFADLLLAVKNFLVENLALLHLPQQIGIKSLVLLKLHHPLANHFHRIFIGFDTSDLLQQVEKQTEIIRFHMCAISS